MRYRASIFLASLLFGTAAGAQCVPLVEDRGLVINLTPNTDFEGRILDQQFQIAVRNDGDAACDLRLSVAREGHQFGLDIPQYQLSGPSGPSRTLTATTSDLPGTNDFRLSIDPKSRKSVPYRIDMPIGWGVAAGTYSEQLVFSLTDGAGRQVDRFDVPVNIAIPAVARLRFAGAMEAAQGTAQVNLGTLSSTTPTVSPPLAVRVLSTAGYSVVITSENGGALRREQGQELIPYQLMMGGRTLNLRGGDAVMSAHHTGASGDVYPFQIVIQPDPLWHAGAYTDRITMTVTPI